MSFLRPGSSASVVQRARSVDHSAFRPSAPSALPHDNIVLPAFLQQSPERLKQRFSELSARQSMRLADGQRGAREDSPWRVDTTQESRKRNRYGDIAPWLKHRVKLRVPKGSSDYINASPITLKCTRTGEHRRYIATQGPKQSSIHHFWQMVWDETEEVAVIVMLTRLVDDYREKCFQYYPEDENSDPMELRFTNDDGTSRKATLRVESAVSDRVTQSRIRTLRLISGEKSKIVYHYYYRVWPDYGVPQKADREALLALIRVSRSRNSGWHNPRIVHCSAGVGRSGTFIALEHLFEELDQGTFESLAYAGPSLFPGFVEAETTDKKSANALDDVPDPIFDTVDELRRQRMMMVQSDEQYAMLYDCLTAAYRTRHLERRRRASTTVASGPPSPMRPPPSPLGPGSPSASEPALKSLRLGRGLHSIIADVRDRSRARKEERSRAGEETARPRQASVVSISSVASGNSVSPMTTPTPGSPLAVVTPHTLF